MNFTIVKKLKERSTLQLKIVILIELKGSVVSLRCIKNILLYSTNVDERHIFFILLMYLLILFPVITSAWVVADCT